MIGDNAFIGYGAIILPETFIVDDCLIAAGAVVRGKVEPDSVFAIRMKEYELREIAEFVDTRYMCTYRAEDDGAFAVLEMIE